jgi:hypothetical protein
MKNTLYIIFLLLPILSNAGNKIELVKKVTKTFPINSSTVIAASNTYGNIIVIHTDESKVTYDIEMKTYADSKERAQEELDRISIVFDESGNRITATTKLESKTKWFSMGNRSSKLEINYRIYLPKKASLAFGNAYGDINIPSHDGPVAINIDYGDVKLEDINNNFVLNMDYGKAETGYLYQSTLNMDYSEIKIKSAKSVDLNMDYGEFYSTNHIDQFKINADYTDFNIRSVNNLTIKGDYSDFIIGMVTNVNYQNDYGTMKIKLLNGNFKANFDYHKLDIESVSPKCKSIVLSGDYCTNRISTMGDCTVNRSGSYGSLNAGTNFRKSKINKEESQAVKGTGNGLLITVDGDYTNVDVK